MRKAILIKPLDGQPEGTRREFNKADYETLERLGAVKLAPEDDDYEEDALGIQETSMDELRLAHVAELEAAQERAKQAEADLLTTRQALADMTSRANVAEDALQAASQRVDELTVQLAAANAATVPVQQDEVGEGPSEGKASPDLENKMLVDPSNKAAAAPKSKAPKAD